MAPTLASGAQLAGLCPIGLTLGMIAGKWKPGILILLGERTLRFGELERRLPHVSRKVLIEQLRGLERDGLLASRVYPEVPPRVEYSLTALGRRALPLLEAVAAFGQVVLDERATTAAGGQLAGRLAEGEGELAPPALMASVG